MDKLKPCPFCGGKPEVRGGTTVLSLTQIRCTDCQCCTAYWRGYDKAVEVWNRRVKNGTDKQV